MSLVMWMGLVAQSGYAQTLGDMVALITAMTEAIEEVESLREEASEEAAVVQCLDDRLIPMRSLLQIATGAQRASVSAESDGQADLEARKVMVAARRQEALLEMARQCINPGAIVTLDCPECPVEEDPTAPSEEVVLGPIELPSISPFE